MNTFTAATDAVGGSPGLSALVGGLIVFLVRRGLGRTTGDGAARRAGRSPEGAPRGGARESSTWPGTGAPAGPGPASPGGRRPTRAGAPSSMGDRITRTTARAHPTPPWAVERGRGGGRPCGRRQRRVGDGRMGA